MNGKPDFDAGDVVECIDASPRYGSTLPLSRGALYRVERVQPKPINMPKAWGVMLVGVRSRALTGSFWSDRFRKVRPASDWFTARIRAYQPINGKVSA